MFNSSSFSRFSETKTADHSPEERSAFAAWRLRGGPGSVLRPSGISRRAAAIAGLIFKPDVTFVRGSNDFVILATETTADGAGKDLTKCEKVGLPQAAQELDDACAWGTLRNLPKHEPRQRHVKPRPQSDMKAFEEKTGRRSGVGFSPSSET